MEKNIKTIKELFQQKNVEISEKKAEEIASKIIKCDEKISNFSKFISEKEGVDISEVSKIIVNTFKEKENELKKKFMEEFTENYFSNSKEEMDITYLIKNQTKIIYSDLIEKYEYDKGSELIEALFEQLDIQKEVQYLLNQ